MNTELFDKIYTKVSDNLDSFIDCVINVTGTWNVPDSNETVTIEYSGSDDPHFVSDNMLVVLPFVTTRSEIAHELSHVFYFLETKEPSVNYIDDKDYLKKPNELIAHTIQACFGTMDTLDEIIGKYYTAQASDATNTILDSVQNKNPTLYGKYMGDIEVSDKDSEEPRISVKDPDDDDDFEFDFD